MDIDTFRFPHFSVPPAIANQVIVEINANPRRMEMDWRFWRRTAEKGLVASINPDAHRTEHFDFFYAGINVAQKGWLTSNQVLNTKPLSEVKAIFRRKRPSLARLG